MIAGEADKGLRLILWFLLGIALLFLGQLSPIFAFFGVFIFPYIWIRAIVITASALQNPSERNTNNRWDESGGAPR
ncbi:hypothetical protein [Dactylococcopsis salina]|uniref:Uncharacterized protein n=1 Tax=Dactylococcopsis salina (strain PCC 8305) TaxID=13035 RepID=K9YSU8_DACS8|nr:hypothetical protein [Dactylococcopsis salina]AFZ49425.1 hypothetical protein Dacsa_0658 [Dactylococcopsis salina PCC 8305]